MRDINNFWDKEEASYWEDYKEFDQKSHNTVFESDKTLEDNSDILSESETVEDLLDVEEVSVVSNARIRLEQGRLYEMLIKHNLFEGVDAIPQAVNKVQSEIKNFIIERLEILLGMKSEKQTEIREIIKESEFNELEVQALKMIASKVTKGASENTLSAEKEKIKSNLKPIKAAGSQNTSLNSIKKTDFSINQKKNKQQLPIKKDVYKEYKTIPNKDIQSLSSEMIAKKDIQYIETLKNMSLDEANKVVSERHNRPRSTVKIDQESVNRNYATKVSLDKTAQAFTQLIAMAKKK